MKLPLCAYTFMLTSGKSTMCFVEEKTSRVLCGHVLLTEKLKLLMLNTLNSKQSVSFIVFHVNCDFAAKE